MVPESPASSESRRQFLRSIVPAGCAGCLLQEPLFNGMGIGEARAPESVSDPDSDSHWTYRRIYRFAYQQWMIPQLLNLSEAVGGRGALIEMLKGSSLALGRRTAEATGASTFEEFADWMEGAFETSEIYQQTLKWEPFRITNDGMEIRITSCLWAETFRGAGASDLGYAVTCFQDVGLAEGLEKILRMDRPSTLMEGGDACVLRFLRT